MVDNFNGKVPSNIIASTCNDFIMPSSRPETHNGKALAVNIPNGWAENRFAFMLTIRTIISGMEEVELVTGYTDRFDVVDVRGNFIIAPDTIFYINSVTKIATRRNIPTIKESFSVLGGGMGGGAYGNTSTWKMTPFNLLHSSQVNSIDGLTDIPANTIVGNDHRVVSNSPSVVSRIYHSPTQIMSKLMDGAHTEYSLSKAIDGFSDNDTMSTIRSKVSDPSVFNSPFLSALSTLGAGRTATFEYSFLASQDPYIDSKTIWTEADMRTTEFSAPWDKPTNESTFALVIANMVTTLMTKLSLGSLEFRSTNMVASGFNGFMPSTLILNILGISSAVNMTPLIGSIENTINDELIPIISRNGEVGYEIHVSCDINTDVTIEIYLDGFENQHEIFVFPSFADAPISPMLTTNTELYRNNSRDIGYVMDIVSETIDVRLGNPGFSSQGNSGFNSPFGNVNTATNYNPAPSSDSNQSVAGNRRY